MEPFAGLILGSISRTCLLGDVSSALFAITLCLREAPSPHAPYQSLSSPARLVDTSLAARTFMVSTGQWATRSTGPPSLDPSGLFGQWSGLCYLGKKGKRLAILTAYQSPRQQQTGGFGFYDQQYSLLLTKGVPKPNVRRQFITGLVQFVNKLQSDGHEVKVCRDANKVIWQDTSFGLAYLLAECTLSDLHLLGSSEPPATYKYGTARRIHYMLGTSPPLLTQFVILFTNNGVFFKHCGLFIDLDFTQIMGSVDSFTPAPARGIRLEDHSSC